VALYRTVKDSSIIPAPPRMSFIVCRDDFTGVLDTSEEDNEIGLLVATKCSCLPLNTKLSVTMKDFNSVQLKHPKLLSGPETLPCTLVHGETYVYYLECHVFMPIWCVLQYYIKKYDDIPWRFEPNRQEQIREVQVLGKNSSNLRPRVDPNDSNTTSGNDYGANSSSGAVFDLTVQSSTVRRTREKKTEQSVVTRQVRDSIELPPSGAEPVASTDGRQSKSTPANPSPLSGQMAAAKNAAFATVRRNRVTTTTNTTDLSNTGTSSAAPSGPPSHPPLSPSAFMSSESPRRLEPDPSMTDTTERMNSARSHSRVVSPTTDTAGDLASNAITNPSSFASSTTPNESRQVTVSASTLVCRAQLFPAENIATASPGNTAVAAVSGGNSVSAAGLNWASRYRSADPQQASTEDEEDEEEELEHDAAVGAATAVITPSCTISCTPSSQAMVSRETFHYVNIEDDFEYEGEATTEASSMVCSGCRKMLRNFTASVVQESERNGIAILSHHFRVCGVPIGKGAFGAVYKALNLDTGRIVAVKQSRVSYDDKTTDLNWREFQTWSMLPLHANVIIFYGASKEVDTHQLLLVMEYASGGSIVQLYRQFRPIPEPLFYEHACGMARGIKHLHDHNVIHGDVKPENVLTRSDGSVAITDFGCSRCSIINSDSNSSSLRRAQKQDSCSWQLFGTAAYMAPEVILNEPHFKSDVWAYACTLLQLWLGRSPWSGGDRHFSAQDSIPLMFYIANEDVVPYTEAQLENTPRWLQRIAQRAFEREVEKRCTIGEIIGILNEYSRAYVQ
jgi:hypothetical protein